MAFSLSSSIFLGRMVSRLCLLLKLVLRVTKAAWAAVATALVVEEEEDEEEAVVPVLSLLSSRGTKLLVLLVLPVELNCCVPTGVLWTVNRPAF